MIESIFNNLDVAGFVISLIALFVSIYSVYYTRKNNRYKLRISDATYYLDDEKPTMISFEVFNDSNKATSLKNVSISQKNNEPIKFLPDFDPYTFYNENKSSVMDYRLINSWEYQSPFSGYQVIPANSSIEFSYYLEDFKNPLIIKIESDELINWFKKTKSFVTHFHQSN